MMAAIRCSPGIGGRDLAAECDLTPAQLKLRLQELRNAGLIEPRGKSSRLRWYACRVVKPVEPTDGERPFRHVWRAAGEWVAERRAAAVPCVWQFRGAVRCR